MPLIWLLHSAFWIGQSARGCGHGQEEAAKGTIRSAGHNPHAIYNRPANGWVRAATRRLRQRALSIEEHAREGCVDAGGYGFQGAKGGV